MWSELANSFRHGNYYVIGIMVVGFFATTVFFERLIMLQFVYHINFEKFLANLRKMVQAEDLERAINLCKNVSSTALPRISLKALEAAEIDPHTVRGRIEEEALDFLPQIEKRIGFITSACLIIMLLGLLGTMDSLWHAFQSVDVLDSARKQATLADGIAGALNPTAIGLLFSLLLLAGHQIIRGMAINLTDRMQHGITVLANLLCPQETTAYLTQFPKNVGATTGKSSEPDFTTPAAVASNAGADSEQEVPHSEASEPSDDVSISDIKDEEEII